MNMSGRNRSEEPRERIARGKDGRSLAGSGGFVGKNKGAGVAGSSEAESKEATGCGYGFHGGTAEAGHVLYLRGKKGLPVKRPHRAGLPVHCNRKGVRRLAGASAISCLTEPFWFLGSDRYLEAITDEVMHSGAAQGFYGRSVYDCTGTQLLVPLLCF